MLKIKNKDTYSSVLFKTVLTVLAYTIRQNVDKNIGGESQRQHYFHMVIYLEKE